MKNNSKNLSFYLLSLNLKKIKLYRASRDEIYEMLITDIPTSLKIATGKDEFEKQLQSHSSSGVADRSGKKIFHGQGVGTNHYKDNIFHFFREIDKGLNKIAREKELPLVIAGVDYLLPIYKKASRYPNLLEKGITGNSERTGLKGLHKKSLPIVASYYLNKD